VATKTADPEAKDDQTQETGGGGGKKKLILMVLPVLLLVGALAYFFVLKPAPTPQEAAAAAAEAAKPSPGVVVPLDAITVNLAAGHYLKLGMTLQATSDVKEAPSGAKALDAAISLYSGMTIDEIADAKGREKSKKELIEKVSELYEKEIYDIYFTTFVYQ
jgi:flagellar FliL protein